MKDHYTKTREAFNRAFGPMDSRHLDLAMQAYHELISLFGGRMMVGTPPARAAKAIAAGMIASHLGGILGKPQNGVG